MIGTLTFPPLIPDAGGIPVVEPKSLAAYECDFPVGGKLPSVNGEAIHVRRDPHPANKSREFTYWHMVTDGLDEMTRRPDLERMVRMPWAKPLLGNHTHETVKRWWNTRKGLRHICLWHPPVNYVMVIKERYEGLFLVTTYCPEPKRKLEFHKEWAAAKKAGRTF